MKHYSILALAMLLLAGTSYADKSTNKPATAEKSTSKASTGEKSMVKDMGNGFIIEDVVLGKGPEAKSGDMVSVHYTGTLENGSKFDSSKDHGSPFQFTLGAGQVIAGWDQGFSGMKVGGKRKLKIPPSMGYGSRAVGPIPANSTLLFDVELLGVNGKSK